MGGHGGDTPNDALKQSAESSKNASELHADARCRALPGETANVPASQRFGS
jgi:hypothetical protein